MQVAGAYLLVVLIWSTTPLAIHWSNSSLSFVGAITLRMLIASLVVYGLLAIRRESLIVERRDWWVYAASALGLFPNMLLVYWAAQFIPSGLMSVIMGTYPFFVGAFSLLVLRENFFTPAKIAGLLLALVGLWIVNRGQANVSVDGAWGIAAMVLACALWGLSTVMVKRLGAGISPLRMGTGSLLVATPFFLLAWWGVDGELPAFVDHKSLLGVGYLVLMGSVLGHVLWFFVLRECRVTSVSLITLITPVMAISWGMLAGENYSLSTLLGVGLIMAALALYQGLVGRFGQWYGAALRGPSGKGVVTSPAVASVLSHRRDSE